MLMTRNTQRWQHPRRRVLAHGHEDFPDGHRRSRPPGGTVHASSSDADRAHVSLLAGYWPRLIRIPRGPRRWPTATTREASKGRSARCQPAHAGRRHAVQHPAGRPDHSETGPAELSHPVFGAQTSPYCPANRQSLPRAALPGASRRPRAASRSAKTAARGLRAPDMQTHGGPLWPPFDPGRCRAMAGQPHRTLPRRRHVRAGQHTSIPTIRAAPGRLTDVQLPPPGRSIRHAR